MTPKHVLQGRPFKHPLHPMLVHLPIGLFPLSLIFDLVSFGVDENWLVRGAFYTMLLGVIGALVAAIPGFIDYIDIRPDHPAKRTANWHMALNLVAVALYVIALILKTGNLEAVTAGALPVILSALALCILGVSGYLGGILVYDDGIAVGRHRRETELPGATGLPIAPAAGDGYYAVAEDGELEEGGTRRIEVEGHVMTIARLDGQVYAFQEFCTHRFGPLSEGKLVDGQVECPWHRSCFNMRTGEVTSGPADVPLKTFEVQVRDGRIHVRVPNLPASTARGVE
jgi:nitrite reductase/ring-hydroxylating ferredoxin subunit/uncharacterized membrane protein